MEMGDLAKGYTMRGKHDPILVTRDYKRLQMYAPGHWSLRHVVIGEWRAGFLWPLPCG